MSVKAAVATLSGPVDGVARGRPGHCQSGRRIACCGQGPASTYEWPWPACWQADKRSPTLRVLWGYSGGTLGVLWGYSGASALMASWRPTVAGRPGWPAGLGKTENGQNRDSTLRGAGVK